MRSFIAIIIFLAATILVIFSQARASTEPPSCGSCGKSNPYEKFCGKLRGDLKYYYDETSDDVQKAHVDLCLDLPQGGVACGVTSDALAMSTLGVILQMKPGALCMKLDRSTDPHRLISVQAR